MHKLLLLFLLPLFALTPLYAQKERAGTWQVALTPHYSASKQLDFSNGNSIDLSGRTGWGFGVGYNFTNHFSLDLNFNSSNGSYNAQVTDVNGTRQHINSNLYSNSVTLGVTYNILEGPFTPYLSANAGTTFVDSNIATGNIYIGCGYYYYCGYYPETYTAVRFNLSAALGLRYDLPNGLFFKGAAQGSYVDYNTLNPSYFINYELAVGMKFH